MTNGTPMRQMLTWLLLSSFLLLSAGAGATEDVSINLDDESPLEDKMILEPWSEGVFIQIEKEYGVEAVKRLRYIYNLVQTNLDKPVLEKLEIVNTTLNLFPWISDKALWNSDDYWATPLETLAQFGGDCEDMAIGKFVMLRLMGVSKKNLYLGYAKIRETGEAHMVLVWLNNDRSKALVLDNLDKEIKLGKDRMDLQAIFLFDADENVILLNDDNGARNIKSEIGKRKLSKLEEIKKRILEK